MKGWDIMQSLHQIKHIDSTSLTLNLPKSFLNRTVEVTVVPRRSHKIKQHLKFKSFLMNPIKVNSIRPWTRDELYARYGDCLNNSCSCTGILEDQGQISLLILG